MCRKIMEILVMLFGGFMLVGEVLLRFLKGNSASISFYYLLPIRTHGFVALMSVFLIVYYLKKTLKKNLNASIIVVIYISFLLLFIDTVIRVG